MYIYIYIWETRDSFTLEFEKAEGDKYCCEKMYIRKMSKNFLRLSMKFIRETGIVRKELKVDCRISERYVLTS